MGLITRKFRTVVELFCNLIHYEKHNYYTYMSDVLVGYNLYVQFTETYWTKNSQTYCTYLYLLTQYSKQHIAAKWHTLYISGNSALGQNKHFSIIWSKNNFSILVSNSVACKTSMFDVQFWCHTYSILGLQYCSIDTGFQWSLVKKPYSTFVNASCCTVSTVDTIYTEKVVFTCNVENSWNYDDDVK